MIIMFWLNKPNERKKEGLTEIFCAILSFALVHSVRPKICSTKWCVSALICQFDHVNRLSWTNNHYYSDDMFRWPFIRVSLFSIKSIRSFDGWSNVFQRLKQTLTLKSTRQIYQMLVTEIHEGDERTKYAYIERYEILTIAKLNRKLMINKKKRNKTINVLRSYQENPKNEIKLSSAS